MSFKILYASSTGHTEYIAEKLNELIPNSKLQDVDDLKDITEPVSYTHLTLPTIRMV